MPTVDEQIMQLAQEQWLDPQILAMAMQAQGWAPMGEMPMWQDPMMWPVWGPQLPPNLGLQQQDVLAQSPLLIHAEEMGPLLQVATQDEILLFIKKIVDLYMGVM